MTKTVTKVVASVAVLAALVFGASALAGSGSDTTSATSSLPGTRGIGQGAAPQGGVPQGGPPPGRFAPVTGTAAARVKAAVLARYPGGQFEHIFRLPDGRYVAHVFTDATTEVHVLVSRDFKVVGTEQDGFGRHDGGRLGPGGPPPGVVPNGAVPNGAAPGGTSKS